MKTKHLSFPLSIKALDENAGTFEGYGAVFGNKDSYGDVIVRGAFQNYLNMENAASKVKMLWQHRSDQPIGVYDEIHEDENGLFVRGRLLVNDIAQAREAYALLKAGALSGLSIGYTVNQNGWRIGDDGLTYLSDINLWEISVVTFPANPLANVDSVKSVEQIKTIRDFENHLRDVGFSSSQAKRIASQGFKAIDGQRDVDKQEAEALLLASLKKLHQSILIV